MYLRFVNPKPHLVCTRLALCLFFGAITIHAQPTSTGSALLSEFVTISVSPGGTTLAVARSGRDLRQQSGRVELWNLQTGELSKTIRGFDGSISSVVFDPSGDTLLTTSAEIRDSKIQVKPKDRNRKVVTEIKWWDVRTGEFQRKVSLEGPLSETAISPDGRRIAAIRRYFDSITPYVPSDFRNYRSRGVIESYEVKFFNALTGKQILKSSGSTNAFASPLRRSAHAVFSPNGKQLAVPFLGEVRVLDAVTGTKLQAIKKIKGTPLCIAFAPDGRTLAIASGSQKEEGEQFSQTEITLWEIATGNQIRRLYGNSDRVSSLEFASDGKSLLMGTLEYQSERTIGTVKVWNFVTNRLFTFNVHEGQTVLALALLEDRASLVLQSNDVVEIRDTKTWSVKHSFEGNRDEVSKGRSRFLLTVKQVQTIGFSADSNTVFGLIPEDGIRFWDARTGGVKNQITEVIDSKDRVALSADGRVLVQTGDTELKLSDLSNGTTRTIPGLPNSVSVLALSPDGHMLAIAFSGGLELRNLGNSTSNHVKLENGANLERMVFSEDSSTLATSDESGTIKVWDVRSAQLRKAISTGGGVTSLAIDPSGQLVASAGTDYLISLWDVKTGSLQSRLRKHENVVNALVFSRDGKTLASGGDDRTAVLWDVVAAKSRQTLKGHDLTVTSLAFSRDGQSIASGGGNATVVLWSVKTGKLDRILR